MAALKSTKSPLFVVVPSLLRLAAVNFVVFAVLAEITSIAIVHLKNWPSSRPTYKVNYNLFWADINPIFGTWHHQNSRFLHQGGCFSADYVTNSYGARDVERSLRSSQPRTIVLGDSFVEGFGLSAEQRLSNLLERDMSIEHLNFGSGGDFGPLQYSLVYKTMASTFDHTAVLVGVLPDNDFHEMDLVWGREHFADRYRPYYAADFSIIYQGRLRTDAGEGLWDHIEARLRAYLASYHVGQYLYSRLYWRTVSSYSGYNDYTDHDLIRLKYALRDIKNTADAHHAQLHVFLIPRANDFQFWDQRGANRLGPIMEKWGRDTGIRVKDLLPDMQALSSNDYREYFLPCDGHWSAKGNATAARILKSWVYGK